MSVHDEFPDLAIAPPSDPMQNEMSMGDTVDAEIVKADTPRDPMHDSVEHWFRYHAPTPDQLPKYESIRAMARQLAHHTVATCPPSPDRTVALRHLRDYVMNANASIALGGK